MNVYSPESTYYFLPTESQFRTDSSPWCERCDFAYHQPALVAELSAHQPGIWHLLTSDDILETAETLNRCQSQIWYWIQKYKEIRRHSKSKESERDPKRNGTRLETLLASLGVSWHLLASLGVWNRACVRTTRSTFLCRSFHSSSTWKHSETQAQNSKL